ncbi:hypothetical protein LTS17_002336 [Exophiala oligosperma]
MPPKKVTSRSKAKSTLPPAPVAPKSGPWSTARILNSTSPITQKDIHSFLVRAVSDWSTSYTEDEKRAIIDSLPPRLRIYDVDSSGKLVCPVTPDFVLGDPHVKAAIPKFKRQVTEGYYEKGWQKRAMAATRERVDGRFDAYLQEQVDAFFGGDEDDEEDGGGGGGGVTGTVEDVASSDGEWKGR